jgi:MFS family permease
MTMRISTTLLISSVVAALSGFLFGFDTVVISGAEQKIQELWRLSDAMHGFAVSSALWGTVFGSLVGAWPTDRFGRKPTLQAIGILYFVSAVWSGLATDVFSFSIARFIGGVGVGIATVAGPLYITEIAPPAFRGRLTGLFQFNIVFGILVAFVSNSSLRGTSDVDWRWMLGVEAIPALAYTLLCLAIPESPRWLISFRGNRTAGLNVFRRLNPHADAAQLDALADEIAHHMDEDAARRGDKSPFWSARLRTPILIAFLVAFFNQLSGINAILYFAPRILSMTGLGGSAAFVQTIGIGITNLIFTMVGLYLIDRIGRRQLLFIGSIGYILSLGLISLMFFLNETPFRVATAAISTRDAYQSIPAAEGENALPPAELQRLESAAAESLAELNTVLDDSYQGEVAAISNSATPEQIISAADQLIANASSESGMSGRIVLWSIFAFIAAHAIGQGAVIWVLISEVFPNEHRAAGQSLGSATHWILAALLTLVFPAAVSLFWPGVVFAFFCFMMVLQLLWVVTMVPETKGVPLEVLQHQLGTE